MAEFSGLAGLLALSGYLIPAGAVQHGRAKKARKPEIPFGERCTAHGHGSNAGRTNGLPWDGTSPVSAGADIDSYKTKKKPQSMKARAKAIREGAKNA